MKHRVAPIAVVEIGTGRRLRISLSGPEFDEVEIALTAHQLAPGGRESVPIARPILVGKEGVGPLIDALERARMIVVEDGRMGKHGTGKGQRARPSKSRR